MSSKRSHVAVGTAALALAAGCTGYAGMGSAPPTEQGGAEPVSRTAGYETAPCPMPNVPGIPQLDLGADFTCGYLTVPEDRSRPDENTIRIAVARVGATSSTPRPDPIVWLAGGPGGSAIATANISVAQGINSDREVIFVDQRGTLHAQPALVCPEIDAFQQEALGLLTTDPATREESRTATEACQERLAGKFSLASFDTTENAADIADLRVALDIEEWNVRGVSYGSDLALQLLRDHPEGIRSVVLDSLVPPQLNLVESLWPNAAEGYEALFGACAAQPECASAHPDLRNEFFSTVRRLDDRPMTLDVPHPADGSNVRVVLDGYRFATLLNVMALDPGSLTAAPAIVSATAAGDGQAAAMALLQTVSPPGLNGYGLMFGVVCREEAAYTDPDRVHAEARRTLPGFPDAVLRALPQATHVFDDCAVWDVGQADAIVEEPARSDVPVLLLNGTLDGVTPPSWAEAATEGLTNSQLVLVPGAGHDVIRWSDCALRVMTDFLESPDAELQTGCIAEMTVPPFEPAR
jgi:pimeloyl-ACP methyl ester carboxylesterase